MKNITGLLLIIVLFCASQLHAQQEEQYTMFMLNKLTYNPAYAGVDAPITLNATTRNQWIGFDGAPTTQKLSADFTLSHKRVGMGLTLVHHKIGITNKINFTGSYAYRIQINEAYLGFGMNASIRYQSNNYRDKRLFSSTDISMDSSIPTEAETAFSPNFGIGIYFKANKFYMGASLPNMLHIHNTKINGISIPLENNHYYFMTGYHIKPSKILVLSPQILLKYVNGAPLDADINLMTTYDDKYKLGLGYRLGGNIQNAYGESIDLMVGLPITKVTFFGISYDITLSQLKKYNNGSIEALLQYRINKSKPVNSINPRYF
ncbi:MAG TPA: type IX secretion system membrane protein PorP/SprF [Saprospiraceae bacterium]|nr:type IX secretion system membrane protein PorP/SprF [Saprospiraceae bacterium]